MYEILNTPGRRQKECHQNGHRHVDRRPSEARRQRSVMKAMLWKWPEKRRSKIPNSVRVCQVNYKGEITAVVLANVQAHLIGCWLVAQVAGGLPSLRKRMIACDKSLRRSCFALWKVIVRSDVLTLCASIYANRALRCVDPQRRAGAVIAVSHIIHTSP